MYKVINAFSDVSDKGFTYRAGDMYPRPGYEPERGRVNELASSSNRLGYPLIRLEAGEDGPKRRGRRRAED